MLVETSSANWATKKNYRSLLIYNSDFNTPAFQAFLANPDKYLKNPIKFFKNNRGDTSTVALVQVDNKLLLVKRYNIKNIWHRLKLWFRPSRARISWQNIRLLQSLNVPTLNPVAILEKRIGPLCGEAYLVYEYIDGTMCFDYFENETSLTPTTEKILLSVANILQIMRKNFIYHGDCHHKNMIVHQGQVILLDLDHMKQYRFGKWRFKKRHQHEIQKFISYLGDNKEAINFFKSALQNAS